MQLKDVMLFALLGLGVGALIAGLAIGVVVVYRGSGVINIATGALAMVGAYLFWGFYRQDALGFHMSAWVAFVLVLVCMAIIGALVDRIAFWPLHNASPLARLASSLGVLLVLQAIVAVGVSSQSRDAPNILPGGTVTIFERSVPIDRFLMAAIAVAVAAVLAALYRWSRFGLATRAAAESDVSAMLVGLSAKRLSMTNTVIATVVAGAFGILAGPLVQLDPGSLPYFVVPALAAAVFARFTSVGIACVAGLLMGVGYSLINYASALTWFPKVNNAPMAGLPELLFFVAVVIAMFVRGASIPGRGELIEKRLPAVPRPERLMRWALIAGVVGVVALIVLPYDFRQAAINSMIGALICLSLVVIVGYVGQMSVVQLALAGAAGFAMSHLATDVGGVWGKFPIAMGAGVAVAVIIGMASAVAALRVRGVALVVVTLAATLAIQNFGFGNSTWGYSSFGSPIEPLKLGGLDLSANASYRGLDGKLPSPIFGFVVLAVTILACLLVANIRRSDLGLRMLAVRSNERAAAAAGIDVRNTKLVAFALAAAIAGFAGALYGYNFGSVSPQRFGVLNALALIAFAYFGGITMITGALFAGLGAAEGLFPHALERAFGLSGTWAVLIGGVALIITLIANPEGIAGTAWKKKQEKERRKRAGPTQEAKGRSFPLPVRTRARQRT